MTSYSKEAHFSGLAAMACQQCQSSFVLTDHSRLSQCPVCHASQLSPIEKESHPLWSAFKPEAFIPIQDKTAELKRSLDQFVGEVPFPPDELNTGLLLKRMQRYFVPVWWVDVDVASQWKAEMGFDYQVMSHKEQYVSGNWKTEEIQRTRIRWEPRLGELKRTYDNCQAPAMDYWDKIRQFLGPYGTEQNKLLTDQAIPDQIILLPNRSTDDAWSEAYLDLRDRAALECQEASGAQHYEQFQWSPKFNSQNWTQFLVPLYSTYYTGDNGQTYSIWIQGQTGKIYGQKRASVDKAKQKEKLIGIPAVLVFLAGLILTILFQDQENILIPGIISLVSGAIAGIFALWTGNQATSFNRNQANTPIWDT